MMSSLMRMTKHDRFAPCPTCRRLALVATIALASCSADPGRDPGGGEATTSADSGRTAKEAEAIRRKELADLEKEAALALAAGDWLATRKLVARGNDMATEAGAGFDPERGRFLLLRGNLWRDQGDEIPARRDYDDAMAIFRVNKDPVGRFRVLLALALLEENLGAYAAAARQLAEAQELLGEVKDKAHHGALLERSGRLAQRQVRLDVAYKDLVEASRIFAELKDRRSQAETLLNISAVEDDLGKPGECRRSLERANTIFKEIGDKDGEVRSLHRLASIYERDGNYGKTRSLLERAMRLYQELNRSSDAMKVNQHISALPEGGKGTK